VKREKQSHVSQKTAQPVEKLFAELMRK